MRHENQRGFAARADEDVGHSSRAARHRARRAPWSCRKWFARSAIIAAAMIFTGVAMINRTPRGQQATARADELPR